MIQKIADISNQTCLMPQAYQIGGYLLMI